MKTEFLLMAQYGTTTIHLSEVAEPLFGMSPAKAARLAGSKELPVPAFRAGSQKSPWLVHVSDLATYLDRQRADATAEWELVSGRCHDRATSF